MNDDKPPAAILGVVWFREEDFDEIKNLMTDGSTAFTDYADWLQSARRSEHHQLRAGHRLIRATIRPKEFKAWCKSRHLAYDGESRKLFAHWYAQQAVINGE